MSAQGSLLNQKPAAVAEKPAADEMPKLAPTELEHPPAPRAEIKTQRIEEPEPKGREWTAAEVELAKATFFRAWPQNANANKRRNPHEPYPWELDLYLHRCRMLNQDPMLNDLYAIWRWDSRKNDQVMTIQTSIDGYRKTAERTGRYAGSDDPVFVEENGRPVKVTQTVYKLLGGVRCPFTATAYWSEYYPGQGYGLWDKMPHSQLAKCAEALALRKAFPDVFASTYTDVEMMQADVPDASPAPNENREALKAPTREERAAGDADPEAVMKSLTMAMVLWRERHSDTSVIPHTERGRDKPYRRDNATFAGFASVVLKRKIDHPLLVSQWTCGDVEEVRKAIVASYARDDEQQQAAPDAEESGAQPPTQEDWERKDDSIPF